MFMTCIMDPNQTPCGRFWHSKWLSDWFRFVWRKRFFGLLMGVVKSLHGLHGVDVLSWSDRFYGNDCWTELVVRWRCFYFHLHIQNSKAKQKIQPLRLVALRSVSCLCSISPQRHGTWDKFLRNQDQSNTDYTDYWLIFSGQQFFWFCEIDSRGS